MDSKEIKRVAEKIGWRYETHPVVFGPPSPVSGWRDYRGDYRGMDLPPWGTSVDAQLDDVVFHLETVTRRRIAESVHNGLWLGYDAKTIAHNTWQIIKGE